MNSDKLNTLLRLAEVLGDESAVPAEHPTGHKVIVRGNRSGVFFGTLVEHHGQEVTLADARHIWYWSGAANTAEIANSGVSKPNDCKIVAPVTRLLVLDAIEVLDCTPQAVKSLEEVPTWSRR